MAVDFCCGLRVGQGHQVLTLLDGLGQDRDDEALGSAPEELSIAGVGLGRLEIRYLSSGRSW